MPSGRRHLRLELILWPALSVAYFLIDANLLRLLGFAAAYVVSSLLLTPDLDLHHNSARRRWGVLGFIWIPYSKAFKHRGVSHSLMFGMITRLAYLSALVAAGFAGAYYVGMALPEMRWQPDWPLIAAVVAGLYTPNVLHVLYDHWDTSRKLRRTRRKIRASHKF